MNRLCLLGPKGLKGSELTSRQAKGLEREIQRIGTLLFVLAAIVVIVVCNCHFIDDAFVSTIGSPF